MVILHPDKTVLLPSGAESRLPR